MSIYIGPSQLAHGHSPKLKIRGLPESRTRQDWLGDAWTGESGSWFANMVGQRLDADEILLQDIILISESAALEYTQLGTQCEWNDKMVVDSSRPIRGSLPLFLQGTCAHYVEWLYEGSGLDLVDQEQVRDPSNPGRLYPALQIHAFWNGSYPLDCNWDDRLRKYPDCLFGVPSTER